VPPDWLLAPALSLCRNFAVQLNVSRRLLDGPGEDGEERVNEVAAGNGDQVRVEDIDGEGRENRGESNSEKFRFDSFEDTDVATLEELSER